MIDMGRRSRSARLVGRDGDLATLLLAVRSKEAERPVVLITGEAGIGKTRLIGELVDRLQAEARTGEGGAVSVVRGQCLRLSDGELAFAPFLEILDSLRDRAPSGAIGALRASLAGAGPEGARSAQARTLRFIEIHDALIGAAGDGALAIVIDDLHWADRSSLDLILFLARRLRGSRVVLIGAYRSDELHRRHPLRPVIAELSRGFVRERIDLGPLEHEAILEQIAELGGTTDVDLARAIVERADGNPFYVEELVALTPDARTLPESIRDVLLARLAALDATTQRLLAACAVVGHEVDANLVADVLQLDAAATFDAVRIAVDHSILVPVPDGRSYRFRHALLEEAVHDDLLPGEKVDFHRRVAASLVACAASDDEVCSAELARHLDLSGQTGAAFDAHLDASAVAFRAFAWAEGVAEFERSAELCAASDGQPGDGMEGRLRELVVPAAMAMNWSGNSGRAIALLRSWTARTEARAEPHAAARMWMALSNILNDVGEELEARAAVDAAVRLTPPDSTTPLGVEILLGLANRAWIDGRNRDALGLAEQALASAEVLGDPALLFRALVSISATRISMGHIEPALRDVERARGLQVEHGWLDVVGHLPTNVGISLTDVGELDAALDIWEEGLRMSRELGITRSWDPWNLPGVALIAFHTGRWSDADDAITASRAFDAPGMPTYFNELVAAFVGAGRGDLATCDEAIRKAAQHTEGLPGEFEGFLSLARAAVADAANDPGTRLGRAESGLASLSGIETFVLRSRLAIEAACGAADLVAMLHQSRDRERIADARARARAAADLALAVDEGRAVPGTVSVRWTRANAALASAEAARADGADDPASWPPIADAFRELGMLPRVAYVQFRSASASIAAAERDAGAALLREAHDLATSIGMEVLLHRIEGVARAARIDLGPAATEPASAAEASTNRWRLSNREIEVLMLLAEGRTNGEIGARLFISTKTASVHVTHILDKLGVSTRTEAALLANRAGLLDVQLQSTE
jgi:DNA-binding CsgD family transcriptional regulator/tetratricopeptide (TPR) repeat protein